MDGWMEKQPVECMCPCTVQTPADDALRARAELICTFWSGERLACPMSGRLSACNLLCPPPPCSSAPPAFLKTFPPTPQLAHKADNELFTAAIHLNTSWCNCLSVIPALIVHPPPSAPPDTLASEHQKRPATVITADEWVWEGFPFGRLESNEPTSRRRSSVSTPKRADAPLSAEGPVESRTAWVRSKAGTCLRPRGLTLKYRLAQPPVHLTP